MKDWKVTNTEVIRKGVPVAIIDGDKYWMVEGKKNFKAMVSKVLKEAGKELELVDPSAKPKAEPKSGPVPEPEPAKEIPVPDVEEMEPIEAAKRDFKLPRDTRLEHPPKEKVVPQHKSTLYFTKNGRGFKLALDTIPTSEEILTIIEEFRA